MMHIVVEKKMGVRIMRFSEMVKDLRIGQGKTLRWFCVDNRVDPSNWSKIERGVNPPPKDEKTLGSWAKMLGLKPASPAWRDFMDQADIARGQIPRAIISNEKLMDKLPVFFRTIRGAELTEKELDEFIEEVRKLNSPDAKRTV
jgi:hypothetical protein